MTCTRSFMSLTLHDLLCKQCKAPKAAGVGRVLSGASTQTSPYREVERPPTAPVAEETSPGTDEFGWPKKGDVFLNTLGVPHVAPHDFGPSVDNYGDIAPAGHRAPTWQRVVVDKQTRYRKIIAPPASTSPEVDEDGFGWPKAGDVYRRDDGLVWRAVNNFSAEEPYGGAANRRADSEAHRATWEAIDGYDGNGRNRRRYRRIREGATALEAARARRLVEGSRS